MRAQLSPSSTLVLTTLLAVVPGNALAQVISDSTLGAEGSLIIPATSTEGSRLNRIEGGAIRGSNLFHSFLEFNIDAGQQLYFANPDGIATILSRVTGSSPSQILGTLGVEGPADLFLLNPNGIVFGLEASLDIAGSFYATTAGAIPLGDGVFSTVEPEQSSLLSVSPSAAFSTYLTEAAGDIQSQGKLTAGEDLSLAANRLDLQGQLAAGGDLVLLAGDTVQIRDSTQVPFIAIAGNDLLVQGNEQVDIVVLSHPDSGLYSYGDMTLRSASAVGGDARYWSGSTFRVETLDGSSGSLYSPVDPIIRAFGDVTFDFYKGTSLHILAGGSVNIGTAVITAPDGGKLGVDFLQETIELSDGTQVAIDGGAQPTLDVRAGVRPDAIGIPPSVLTGFEPATDAFLGKTSATQIPLSADIRVGDVLMAASDGLVLLTNQYAPNSDLAGGNISVTGTGAFKIGISAGNSSGQGSTVLIDSRGDLEVTNSLIGTTSPGKVGDIVLTAADTVTFDGTDGRQLTGAFAGIAAAAAGTGGSIKITATNLNVLNGARLNSTVSGRGEGGNVSLNIRDTARFVGFNPISGIASGASTSINQKGEGVGGNLLIQATNLAVLEGAQLSASVLGKGTSGSVILDVADIARFEGSNPIDNTVSGAFSRVGTDSEGLGGNVQISASTLQVLEGAQISASTFGIGDSGSVLLDVRESAYFEGSAANAAAVDGGPSGAFSRVETGSRGNAGSVQIQAARLDVVAGATLSTETLGQGSAGNLVLEITETARFEGFDSVNRSPSGALSRVGSDAVGKGGDIRITANRLAVLDGATLSASTLGKGDAGSVILNIADTARFEGSNPFTGGSSGVFSAVSSRNPGSQTAGGDVQIQAQNLEVLAGAQLTASVFGEGTAGSVILDITETARFDGFDPSDNSPSGAFSRVSIGGKGAGGNVQISATNLEVSGGAQLSTSTFGEGNAGNVVLEVAQTATFNGVKPTDGAPSGAFSGVQLNGKGDGGGLNIRAGSLAVLEGAQLTTSLFGQGNAGSITLDIADTVRLEGRSPIQNNPSGIFSNSEAIGIGQGGDISLQANRLSIRGGAGVFASSLGQGEAGNVVLTILDLIESTDGTIATNAEASAGGQIQIQAGSILLLGDSDIQTFVRSGENSSGDITISANFLIALDDSDILAFAVDGRGGNIDFTRTAFFGQDFQIAAPSSDPSGLDGNSRVDISATGGLVSGTISLPDVSFIENSLNELAETTISPETLTAGSCIAQGGADGSFVISSRDGLPNRPGEVALAPFATGSVQPLDRASDQRSEAPQVLALQEPEGLYQLEDGRLVLSRVCQD